MLKLPEVFYVLKFWEFLSLAVAGVLGLLYTFGLVPLEYAVPAGSILAWALAMLRLLGIDPKLLGLRKSKPEAKPKAKVRK